MSKETLGGALAEARLPETRELPAVQPGARPPTPTQAMPIPLQVTPAFDRLVGEKAGSFRLTRVLGRGGMGSVYLGENELIGSRVAVKVLHAHLAAEPDFVRRFLQEARAANLVRHPHVVSTLDVGSLPDGRPYLVMEYVDGCTLEGWSASPREPARVAAVLAQVCEGLEAAHPHLVHRDLKPENLFLLDPDSAAPFAKIADFGIAKLSDAVEHTRVGLVVGTPAYMAPELFEGGPVTGAADLYSLGVIAYQLLTGRLPFEGRTVVEWCRAHRDQAPPPLRALRPEVPAELEGVVLRALAKRPEERWPSARALGEALRRAAVERPGASGLPVEVQGVPGAELLGYDFTSGGIYLASEAPPPLRSRVRLRLRHPGGTVECEGEVVQHVGGAQAQAWGRPAGYAVQFVAPSPELRARLSRLARGQQVQAAPAPSPGADPVIESLLSVWDRRGLAEPYPLLGLARDAGMADVRRRLRQLGGELDGLASQPLTGGQLARLARARAVLARAEATLGDRSQRAAYDARLGNYVGVARCLAAGLTASELEGLESEFEKANPGARAEAHARAEAARHLAEHGSVAEAVGLLERALRSAPLSLALHQRYWPLRSAAGR